ncbi:SDR family oxidoreductase [Oceanirhabdus sp. W0125-5]|uniref:SDR family oxidoreductase n=1 Tax=Oceanirhabdus sp. W0125-5 TaxID=2999116 RepID=UPI0022F2E356|nr:NAD(P)-dependent oxidoreductase [Oceanirhabdus sp. W0125-5]WBW94708.1 NAD(P)-dependent oxidoreductase [Oceanirhabdus sp. W0125-5]
MKILITGGTGFLATRFKKRFEKEYEILALGRNELDITDGDNVEKKFTDFNPDIVIHTAAIADTGKCENNPELSYKINVQGSINVAKACKNINAKLVYMSSEQVYNGNEESGPYSEETLPVPNTVYGKHKLKAEEEIQALLHEVWILRLTWLFGMPERNLKVNSNILFNTIKNIISGKEFTEPVNEFRGMTYVYDIVDNIPKLFSIPYGIYNTGSENNLSRYHVVESIINVLGRDDLKDNKFKKDFERFKNKPRDLRISNAKFREQGIEFSNTEEGIVKALKEYSLI